MKAKVEVIDIHKSFDGLKVLDGVSFSVEAGELLCLLGPSRCGKTTLLRIIIGLETPDSGEVKIDGQPIDPKKHKIGYVPQDIMLMPWLTVYENIALGLKIRGASGEQIRSQVEALMKLIRIEAF
ncbi:MAG: ATP-binding cassette domain-containing protein, partial [Candidatus Hecatellaceae archaeon]